MGFATVAGIASLWRWLQRSGQNRAWITPLLAALLVILGGVQYALPTRTDGFTRLPIPVTARDEMRRHVASQVLPRDVPLALQFGLWGVTPWRPDTVFLQNSQLKDHHYVFVDLYGIHGLTPEENNRVMLRLREEVNAGRRRELFDAYDFVILSPAK
jgi:hypothetical protein